VALDPRDRSHTSGVARLSLSTYRAEPISLVRTSEDLLSVAPARGFGFNESALCWE
jgi:hypothetical protein